MSTKGEQAFTLFHEGYNCCQAVVGAYCQDYGLDMESAMRLTSSLGAGMGRMRLVCGAVSGMFLVAGWKYGSANPKDAAAKGAQYARIQALAKAFEEENGSIICAELLGISGRSAPTPQARTAQYYQKRPCAELVRFAADLLESRDWK